MYEVTGKVMYFSDEEKRYQSPKFSMGFLSYFSLKSIVTFFFAWASVTFSGVTPTRTHMAPKTSLTQDGGVLTVFIMVTSELLIVDKMAVTPMLRKDLLKIQYLLPNPISKIRRKKSGNEHELQLLVFFFSNLLKNS